MNRKYDPTQRLSHQDVPIQTAALPSPALVRGRGAGGEGGTGSEPAPTAPRTAVEYGTENNDSAIHAVVSHAGEDTVCRVESGGMRQPRCRISSAHDSDADGSGFLARDPTDRKA